MAIKQINGDYKTPFIDVLPDYKDDWQEIEDTEGAEGERV